MKKMIKDLGEFIGLVCIYLVGRFVLIDADEISYNIGFVIVYIIYYILYINW